MPRSAAAIIAALAVLSGGCGARKPASQRLEWIVMGTIAAVQTRGAAPQRARDCAAEKFTAIEKLLNAHDPSSELSALAGLPDAGIVSGCNPSVRKCYIEAFRFRDITGGAFNPRWKGDGTMDLGAIAKGFALDAAAEAIASADMAEGDVLLDLGGNLKAVKGEWRVAVYGSGETLLLKEGAAVATSGEAFRGRHIFDGRTHSPVFSPAKSVSVLHPSSATLADALSTVLFIMGEDEGAKFLSARFPEARAIWSAQ